MTCRGGRWETKNVISLMPREERASGRKGRGQLHHTLLEGGMRWRWRNGSRTQQRGRLGNSGPAEKGDQQPVGSKWRHELGSQEEGWTALF